MSESKMYGLHAADYAKAVESNVFNAHYERPSMLALMGDVQGKEVLDAGCGSGEHMLLLAQKGASVLGFDASKELVAIANDKMSDHRGEAFVHDFTQPLSDLKDDRFDVVNCSLAIHYVEELTPVFREFARVLKPGGNLLLSTHHPIVDFGDSPSQNYFKRELLVQEWDTIGKAIEVKFYRRPMTELLGAAFEAGLVMSGFSEGAPDESLKDSVPKLYERLTTKPAFVFFRFEKSNT